VIAHVSTWAAWNYEARLQLLQLLADNPDLTIDYPGSILYDATEAAELGEPGAVMAFDRSQAFAERAIPRQARRLRAG
jgi:hypothetical protein